MAKTSDMAITDGKIVTFHYTLTNDAGEVIDSSSDGDPMEYLHGADNIVPGLERQLTGRGVGDRFTADVPPEEGYGVRDGGGPQAVPRSAFPPNAELIAGMQFAAQGPDGSIVPIWVTRVDDDTVFIDRNHPLAGETLHFQVDIVAIRDATSEEMTHGHPHGPAGC